MKMMNCKKILFKICIGAFFLVFTSPLLWALGPGNLIKESIDKGLNILKDPALQGDDKVEERRQKLWQELSPMFDFDEMSKRALGKYWKERSPEEKQEFTKLFTEILKDSYIGKTDTYSGEKIELVNERKNARYAKIQTKIILDAGKNVSVNFSMLNQADGWKIYDVIIEGVSLVNNYRSQFNSILIKSPYESLIEKLKTKVEN